MKFSLILGCCFILLMILLYLWSSKRIFHQESMTNDLNGSYILSNVSTEDSPRESWEKVQTVDSAGDYSISTYDIRVHSREKLQCIAPAAYNSNTFNCDCPIGSDYNDVYGCISKCQPYQTYYDFSGNGMGVCLDVCDMSANQFYDAVSNACLQCPLDHYSDGNNNCLPLPPCPAFGKYVDNSRDCSFCPANQIFNDKNQCVTACPSFQLMRNGVCEPRCPIRTQYWNPTTSSCTNCPVGYVVNTKNQCVPSTSTCRPGEKIGSSNTCISVCLDYERWDSSFANCIPKCASNQYYSASTQSCALCPMGQVTDGRNGCHVPPPPPVPTPKCPLGFTLNGDSTACETICPYWRYNAEDDPTQCELLCPIKTQYYEKDINNGCTHCPVGYIADPNNQCTMCDSDNGYFMMNGVCAFECASYQKWNAITDVCDYNCPDNNTYYVDGVGCQYCPKGYLVDKNNNCNVCDVANGYSMSGDGTCKSQCKPWEYWNTTYLKCMHNCPPNQFFDVDYEMCVTCQEKYPDNYILGFNSDTNVCTVGGKITQAPKVIPTVYVPPVVAATPPPVVAMATQPSPPPPTANLSVNPVSLNPQNGLTLSITANYSGTVTGGASSVPFNAGNNVSVTVPVSLPSSTSSPATTITVKLSDVNQTSTSLNLTYMSTSNYVPSSSNYLAAINFYLVGGGGGGGSGGGGSNGCTGCTGGGGGAGQVVDQRNISVPISVNDAKGSISVFIGGGGNGGGGSGGNGNAGGNGATTILTVNGNRYGTANGGGGGKGGGYCLGGDNCSGGAGGTAGDGFNGNGFNGNDWGNSDSGHARGGNNGSGYGGGGSGGWGGRNGSSPDPGSGGPSAGQDGYGTYTAYFYSIS